MEKRRQINCCIQMVYEPLSLDWSPYSKPRGPLPLSGRKSIIESQLVVSITAKCPSIEAKSLVRHPPKPDSRRGLVLDQIVVVIVDVVIVVVVVGRLEGVQVEKRVAVVRGPLPVASDR